MSIRERLKIAYENVAYSADKTWRTEYFHLQKSHMDLYLRESQLQHPTNLELRPRTVRDCIPNSKLARYSNYEYSYSRELSYNMDNVKKPSKPSKISTIFDKDSEKELWMLEEVEQLFKFYSNGHIYHKDVKEANKRYSCKPYESPFFKTNSLSECFLKMLITNVQVKKIWDIRIKDSEYLLRSSTKEDPYLLYKSRTGQVFLSEYDKQKQEFKNEICEWHRNDQLNIQALNLGTKNFEKDKMKIQVEPNSIQHRRLYSAVLQGFSSSKIASSPAENRMTILKRNLTRNGMEKLGGINEVGRIKMEDPNISRQSEDIDSIKKLSKSDGSPNSTSSNFNNKTYTNTTKNSIGTVYNPLYTMNHFQSQIDGLNHQNRLFSNSFIPQAPNVVSNLSLAPRFRQAYAPSNCQYPFYMLIQNSLHQQNFLQPLYNPMVLHRSTPMTFERSIPQRTLHVPVNNQFVTPQSGNIPHNQYKTSNSQKADSQSLKARTRIKLENLQEKKEVKSSGLISLVNVRKISDISSYSSCNSKSKQDTTNEDSYEELEKLVLKTVNMVLDDSRSETIVPVTESSSERLERQALEQYQSSYDNVFLELERQAAEEYDNSPENYKDPPNRKMLFGGFFIHYFCFSMDKYFKYLVS